jgi:hypothetical protein
MATCLKVEEWRASTRAEIAEFLSNSKKPNERVRETLAVRVKLKPVDVYAYLKARFGEPNGFQNLLRKDDSDNIVHWDFQLKAGNEDVYICGYLREVHLIVSEKLTDEEWKELINAIKADFSRVAKDKSAIVKSFEKYILFQNKYAAIANLCADLHASILETPDPVDTVYPSEAEESVEASKKSTDERSKRIERLFGDCLKLRLLMPVMAEAYINMLILTFCKNAIRDDETAYNAFLRSNIPERLELLSIHCDGFSKAVDKTVPGYGDFMTVINRRNFALHGNVDPIREPIEIVYFEKRRPLFVHPGNSIELLFQYMEAQADPAGLLKEYEQLHDFLVEMTNCLAPRNKRFFEQVISDAYPGFKLDVRRPTRLFPDHYVWSGFPGMRYDDQLDVEW